MNKRDVLELYAYPDDHTRDVINDALEVLGILRGFPRLVDDHADFLDDLALRLHLLVSLQQELKTQILHTLLNAHDQGYTPTELDVLLDHPHL